MNLHHLSTARLAAGRPVCVALIGAGKFGSMFLNQVPHSPYIAIAGIADLDPQRARDACRLVGWSDDRMAATRFTESGMDLIADDAVEVIVEITGSSAAGVAHALAAAKYGKPIIMVNVEADVLAGPLAGATRRRRRHRLLHGLWRPAGA